MSDAENPPIDPERFDADDLETAGLVLDTDGIPSCAGCGGKRFTNTFSELIEQTYEIGPAGDLRHVSERPVRQYDGEWACAGCWRSCCPPVALDYD